MNDLGDRSGIIEKPHGVRATVPINTHFLPVQGAEHQASFQRFKLRPASEWLTWRARSIPTKPGEQAHGTLLQVRVALEVVRAVSCRRAHKYLRRGRAKPESECGLDQ